MSSEELEFEDDFYPASLSPTFEFDLILRYEAIQHYIHRHHLPILNSQDAYIKFLNLNLDS